ncbi:MAG: metallophosphoesterase [Sandaracinaceae bacterium]|nr:metallophosphoesterase [Sandaracinaceae bacterium]
MRLAWLTDIHLDFLSDEEIATFAARVAREAPDGVVVTGDISIAPELGPDLAKLVDAWRMPCWFVAGNHDYYGADVASVRRGMRELSRIEPKLRWLPSTGVVSLTPTTALVGVDGWADGRIGDGQGTSVVLNDHLRIRDLLQPSRAKLLEAARRLADEDARTLATLLGEALAPHEHVIVATHVPPFREASTHAGRIAGDDWLPWMTCHAIGETLRAMATDHPTRKITVLAGHTHDACRVSILPNLEVRTGAVEYGAPTVQEVFELGE